MTKRRDLHRLHNDRTPIAQRGKATQKRTEWDCIRDMVHTPVHAFWLNQIEIYFSIIQRKVLLPNNFTWDTGADFTELHRARQP